MFTTYIFHTTSMSNVLRKLVSLSQAAVVLIDSHCFIKSLNEWSEQMLITVESMNVTDDAK